AGRRDEQGASVAQKPLDGFPLTGAEVRQAEAVQTGVEVDFQDRSTPLSETLR
ncbi:MAG: hypothetical protein HKP27_01080, partial [Myxococcales bacterium]|nr:hypothetical protein [Myxococcales bacterium]